MKVFVDTAYWIAILNPDDQLAGSASAAHHKLGETVLVTTEEILTEFLNAFCSKGTGLRDRALDMVLKILSSPKIQLIEQSHDSFLQGLELYVRRSDKGYNFSDCISMATMRRLQIPEVLTADRHFRQEGFTTLL